MERLFVSYLLLINLRKPVPEHGRIKPILKEISPNAKAVYFDRHGGAFLFNTNLELGQVYARFDKVFMNDDSFMIVEIGPRAMTFGNDIALAWLQRHLGKQH